METCEILIVEDNEEMRNSWIRDIRDFNRSNPRPFNLSETFATTKNEAIARLRRFRFDCAIVDLRLPHGDATESADRPLGNDVIEVILDLSGIPTYVYSGFDAEASDLARHSNIRVIPKQGGASRKILASIASEAPLMEAMERTRSILFRETSKLFNQSIWSRWEKKWSGQLDKDVISGIIARQTISHIAESLAKAPAKHHPEEFYIVPSLHSNRLDTGDILELGKKLYVVLTPRCNMANSPPGHYLLASLLVVPDWIKWKADLLGDSGKKRERAEKEIRSHANQGHEIGSHFLPPLNGDGPWLVDFKEARTIRSRLANKLVDKRVATVAPQFVPNLVQRYSSYLGRIGQPDIGDAELIDLCKL
ncbi:TPA: response regulator [Stenotrophomonas maltophilia]|nr:response regulator [Stenotrophomonas maltophilia]